MILRPCRRPALVLLGAALVAFAAPGWAVEEIVRMETRVVDCPNMLPGTLGCQQHVHTFTTTNPNETRAGRTFAVYTRAEIDQRLEGMKKVMIDPAIRALAEEVAELRRALVEAGAVCAEPVSGSRAPARPAAAR
ncbi:MAG TPA: hypothetical protein VJU81_22530 [Methylomirabilota bacterium]|nr:hypothetical protein [Methylomirabilota bacterium]